MMGSGQLGSVHSDGLAWAELTVALDWLPLASLLLAADGTALAVSRAWSDLSGLAAEDSLADGWASAVEFVDREGLRARLRDAAAARHSGYADARLTGGSAGRRGRWWWRPGPSGRLIVCVADLGEFPGSDDRIPPTRLVRRDELANLAERARRHSRRHGGQVTVAAVRLNGMADPGSGPETASDLLSAATDGVRAAASPAGAAAEVTPGGFVATSAAVAEEPGRSAGELSEEAVSTVRPRWNAPEADPQPGAAALGHDLPALADMLVQCLFTAGLAVQTAATLADGPVAAQLEQVTDQLDGIICDTRTALFESQAPEHRYSPQAS